jgi:hypothetical protein
MLLSTLLPLVLGLGAPDAQAANNGPMMWGVGPTFSTIAFPGGHPLKWPKLSEADAALMPAGELDDNRKITTLDEVRGDMAVGARGVFYFNKEWRGGLRTHLFSAGANYNALDFTLEADKMLFNQSRLGAYGGVGLGFGKMKFGAEESDAELKLSTYLLRGQLGGIYRLKKAAIEVGLFVQPTFPGLQEYTATDGTVAEIEGLFGSKDTGGGGTFWHGGLEATVYFGDFQPPKKKSNKKGGKK